ncbi:MAG: response regulator transcription factor [Terriglobia bacterium]|nr:response regulator transcription factor [Terriglobia bacterium]
MRCAIFGRDSAFDRRLRRVIREHGWYVADVSALTTVEEKFSIDVAFLLAQSSVSPPHVQAMRCVLPAALILVIGEASLQLRADALAAGATDFIPSNASSRYFAARIMALVRLRKSIAKTRIIAGEIEIDLQHHRCVIGNRELQLSQKEFSLLTLLAASYGRTTPRSELIEGLWQAGAQVEDNTLDVHISRLRRKLGYQCGERIATIRGIGYRLVPAEENSTGAA